MAPNSNTNPKQHETDKLQWRVWPISLQMVVPSNSRTYRLMKTKLWKGWSHCFYHPNNCWCLSVHLTCCLHSRLMITVLCQTFVQFLFALFDPRHNLSPFGSHPDLDGIFGWLCFPLLLNNSLFWFPSIFIMIIRYKYFLINQDIGALHADHGCRCSTDPETAIYHL